MDRTPALDGLRGWAALVVFWSHTSGHNVWGGTGVWLFFILSGFLLFRPFVLTEYKTTATGLAAYGVRRVLRVWPLLVVAVCFYAAFVPVFGGWPSALNHALMIRGDMHFWTIKQEMLFYLVLPLFVWVCALNPKRAPVILAVAAVVSYLLFDVLHIVSIPWETIVLKFRVVPFIIGMLIATTIHMVGPKLGRALFWFGLVGCLLVSSSWIYTALDWNAGYFEWHHPYVLWPFIAALLIGTYVHPAWIMDNPVMRQLGTWGYGIYIWHMGVVVLLAGTGWPEWVRTPAALAITVALSAAGYLLVERPSMALGKRLSRAIAGQRRQPAIA